MRTFTARTLKTVRNDDAEFSAPVKEIPRKINGSGDASAEFSAPSEIDPNKGDPGGGINRSLGGLVGERLHDPPSMG